MCLNFAAHQFSSWSINADFAFVRAIRNKCNGGRVFNVSRRHSAVTCHNRGKMNHISSRLLLCLAAIIFAGSVSVGHSAPVANGAAKSGKPAVERERGNLEAVVLAPHRAVYDISLDHSSVGSTVEQLQGRMVYELQGNVCEGYTQNLRFVTRATSKDGSSRLSDLRTSSWEDGASRTLRFGFQNYFDNQLAEKITGTAKQAVSAGGLRIALRKPEPTTSEVKTDAMFPIRHAKTVIAAAQRGEAMVSSNFYDGSDKGQKIYATTAVIGKPVVGRKIATLERVENGPRPETTASWPVAMSYFSAAEQKKDTLPEFEMSYRFHANGLTSAFVIDHGDFAFKGELVELRYLPVSECKPQGDSPPAVRRD
jgi:EipB-like